MTPRVVDKSDFSRLASISTSLSSKPLKSTWSLESTTDSQRFFDELNIFGRGISTRSTFLLRNCMILVYVGLKTWVMITMITMITHVHNVDCKVDKNCQVADHGDWRATRRLDK